MRLRSRSTRTRHSDAVAFEVMAESAGVCSASVDVGFDCPVRGPVYRAWHAADHAKRD